ncbi:MAG: N-acetyltransferase, partial [Pseudomonadota bacterium]
MWPEPLTLSGTLGRLEPLTHAHGADLAIASAEQNLHDLWYTTVPAPDAMAAEIDRRLGLQATGSMLPFAICSTATNTAVGMTTYMNIDATNRRVEIGSTW